MSDTVISIEGLSKSYLLGHQARTSERYRTLRDSLAQGTANLGRITMDMFRGKPIVQGDEIEEYWALDDVSFDVKRGESVGIIGRNGAGKSTLLKILGRITEPTRGHVQIKGRVASLLEVGTGFHPELSGRENIFLNGAVLGMSRQEIRRKIDEIVDFAEVEKFLDTPVKRFSSGMYMRLAFSIAAHLEPEVLVVDEVLAVGDLEFQRKCLGKMHDLGQRDVTLLFVSHNMAALSSLCNTGILLEQGRLVQRSSVENCIDYYLSSTTEQRSEISWSNSSAASEKRLRFLRATIQGSHGKPVQTVGNTESFHIVLEYEVLTELRGLRIGFMMQRNDGIPVCGSNDPDAWPTHERPPGQYTSRCIFPSHILNAGTYSFMFGADLPPYDRLIIDTDYCLSMTVVEKEGHGPMHETLPGLIRPKLEWNVEQT
jgi:lipopolysaccharide transport system ATP-binding protein